MLAHHVRMGDDCRVMVARNARIGILAALVFLFGRANGSDIVIDRFVDELPIPPVVRVPSQSGPVDLDLHLSQFKARFYRDLPETDVWGYNGSSPGPTIEVERGQELHVHWINDLPQAHLFPRADEMMPGMAAGGHGHGHSMPEVLPAVRNVTHLHGAVVSELDPMNRAHNNDGWPDAWNVPGEAQLAEYPNDQSARALWYHDHAMLSTARNVYAGLAGMYLIRDPYERSLNLPQGKFEVPLLFQARGFNDDGTLYYPDSGHAEFYGNTITVNGKIYPYLNVEPRKYRFRMLNASNARSLAFALVDVEDESAGPGLQMIGSDAGFLEKPVVQDRLTLAPAERADVIVDFSKFAGKTFLLDNNSITDPGEGELFLREVMIFKVGTTLSGPDTSQLPQAMAPIARLEPKDAAQTRRIVMSMMPMADGSPMLMLNGKHWNDPIEEKPVLGTTEVWELVNTLPDTHPFHVHLVEFQILDRTPFDVDEYLKSGRIVPTGAAELPDPNEMGWKDTVRVYPTAVTRIIMRFTPFAGKYVYHCHILEHEDMDMMRPFEVVPK
jgi:spore coat protein A